MPITKLEGPPLSFNAEWDRWVLTLPRTVDDDHTFQCVIRCGYRGDEGWFEYRYVRWDVGDWIYLTTKKDYIARLEAIEENEGHEVRNLWNQHQREVEVVFDKHPVFALRDHWEAMMRLGLFSPSVNQRAWFTLDLNDEAKKFLDAARDRYVIGAT